MSEKQTYCPNCFTKYKVSVAQLTVARGMVCCAKCSTNFNALTHLVVEKDQSSSTTSTSSSIFDDKNPQSNETSAETLMVGQPPKQHLLDIFDQKVENSNIDLKTYLNNLNYFSTDPIGTYPALNWSEKSEQENKKSSWNYVLWGVVNLCLISLLIFQFFWFNPKILNNSPVFSALFNTACQAFNCSVMEQNYRLISTNKVKIKQISKKETQFTGELINYHSKSLALPIIKVNLKDNGEIISSYSFQPSEYLIDSLTGIQRIPQNSPFKFKFSLPVERKSFDTYSLEIIRP
ncbi:DUF3426 domain-containing protein [Acinetobacter terrae]|jgi:predicted Zn finger-like uncharacterized protein|uniref:DUF3426 domain-containing protein n=1 Tax=Acinetobacter terrae TaxID=2731247 RepID=UPI0007D73FCD|nr:DUF3426 domain-containing protein [Acinetobacter terrae]NNH15476.1 DUF3426 domain-containing protein [Acinetobacter terrae]OAL81883.1 hypothetical protein AY608_03920 [Acinetobacter terrae]